MHTTAPLIFVAVMVKKKKCSKINSFVRQLFSFCAKTETKSPLSCLFSYQEVVVGERSRGGRLLEEPKILLFKGNTFSLQVSIQDVPRLLWSIKPFTTCQVGLFPPFTVV